MIVEWRSTPFIITDFIAELENWVKLKHEFGNPENPKYCLTKYFKTKVPWA